MTQKHLGTFPKGIIDVSLFSIQIIIYTGFKYDHTAFNHCASIHPFLQWLLLNNFYVPDSVLSVEDTTVGEQSKKFP